MIWYLLLAPLSFVVALGCRELNGEEHLSDNLYQEQVPPAEAPTTIPDSATIEINPVKIYPEALKKVTGEDNPILNVYVSFYGVFFSEKYRFKKFTFTPADLKSGMNPFVINVRELNSAVRQEIGRSYRIYLEIAIYDYDYSWLDPDDFVGRSSIALSDLLQEQNTIFNFSAKGKTSLDVAVNLKGVTKEVVPIDKNIARKNLLNELEKDRQYLLGRYEKPMGNFKGDNYVNFIHTLYQELSTQSENNLKEVVKTDFGGFSFDLVQAYVDILRQVDATTFDVNFSVKILNPEIEQEKGAEPVRKIFSKNFRANYSKDGYWAMEEIK